VVYSLPPPREGAPKRHTIRHTYRSLRRLCFINEELDEA